MSRADLDRALAAEGITREKLGEALNRLMLPSAELKKLAERYGCRADDLRKAQQEWRVSHKDG